MTGDTKTIYVDPDRGPLIQKAFELYATGNYTLSELRGRINDAGLIGVRGGVLSKGNFHRFLQNPIYCGLIRYKGELYQGRHPAIISKSLFDCVQDVLKQKSRPKKRHSRSYPLQGIFRCGECGCMITHERQKGHLYLRCTKKKDACSQSYVREEEMFSQISDHLLLTSLTPDDGLWMLDEIEKKKSKAREITQKTIIHTQDALSKIKRQLDLLQKAYLDEVIPLEDFRSQRNELVSEQATLQEKLRQIDQKDLNRLEPVSAFIKACIKANSVAKEGDTHEKARLLKKIGSNHQMMDREIVFKPEGAWKIVTQQGFIEAHEKTGVRQNAKIISEGVPPSILRTGWDSNPRDLAAQRFSRPPRSTTLPPVRVRTIGMICC
jgi:site-specific DNA recombinase